MALGTRVVLVQANEALDAFVSLVSVRSAHFLLMFANSLVEPVLSIGEPAVIDESGFMYLCGIHSRDA